MHIYAFGSVCRGEVDIASDIDLLAIVEGYDERFDPDIYSIYSYRRIQEIWKSGNPFAWHLATEAILLYSDDKNDFLKGLEMPSPYKCGKIDCLKFQSIFIKARDELQIDPTLGAFLMSSMFLGYRNFATCYSLIASDQPTFSRHSAYHLFNESIPISKEVHEIFVSARILCTRGLGNEPTDDDIHVALESSHEIQEWMNNTIAKVETNG